VLKHAFARRSINSQGLSHQVNLANNTAVNASFSTICYRSGFAPMAGNPGTVPAGRGAVYSIGNPGLGCNVNDLVAIELIFDVPNGSVWGAVTRTTPTGDTSFDTMIGSQLGSR
jgi:hypothetical protein